jgi:hypothetical protein
MRQFPSKSRRTSATILESFHVECVYWAIFDKINYPLSFLMRWHLTLNWNIYYNHKHPKKIVFGNHCPQRLKETFFYNVVTNNNLFEYLSNLIRFQLVNYYYYYFTLIFASYILFELIENLYLFILFKLSKRYKQWSPFHIQPRRYNYNFTKWSPNVSFYFVVKNYTVSMQFCLYEFSLNLNIL